MYNYGSAMVPRVDYGACKSILDAVCLCRIADMFTGHLKAIMITLCVLSSGCMLWLCLLLDNIITPNLRE